MTHQPGGVWTNPSRLEPPPGSGPGHDKHDALGAVKQNFASIPSGILMSNLHSHCAIIQTNMGECNRGNISLAHAYL